MGWEALYKVQFAHCLGSIWQVDTKNLSSNDLLKGFRKSEMYSANGKTAAGRTVILSGFPQRTNTSHVSRWLHSKGYYPEDDEENAIIQAPT